MSHLFLADESTVAVFQYAGRKLHNFPLQAGCLSAVVLLSGQSLAQQSPEVQMPQAPKAPSIESVSDNTTRANQRQTLVEPPKVSGRLELNLQQADAQDDVSELRRDTGEAEIRLSLAIEQQWGPTAKFVAQAELSSRRFTEDELNNEDDEFSYDLERLYLQLNPGNAFRLRAGRIGIDDPMETIIDEDLDGLQATFDSGSIRIDLSHTREDWFEASTLGRLDQITNTMGSVQLSPNKKSRWMPYALHRSTEAFNNITPADVTWLGVQGIVQPDNSPIRYWLHGSLQDGEETRSDERIELGGYMVDVGINWTARGSIDPTFTVAIAHATGGARDERFRQSGLQSNDFALNGKNSFRYLGEVMDPELTNIQIITLGFGADLSRHWSADLALHHYQQVEKQDAIRGADIEYDPLGISDELGLGADIVFAYEPNKRFDVKGTAGIFEPGDAFDENREMAWIARLEFDYNF